MGIEYSEAKSVKAFAEELIQKYHPHLSNVKIEYVFRSEAVLKNGREVWGKARLIRGLNAWLATPASARWERPEPFFCIEIALPIWTKLKEHQQKALVDHELQHCERDIDSGDLTLIGHDVENFGVILRRHGMYTADIETFIRAGAEQLSLLSLVEDRAKDQRLGEQVTFQRLDGTELTLTREEILAAAHKLELETKIGDAFDEVAREINENGALNRDGAVVTMTRIK